MSVACPMWHTLPLPSALEIEIKGVTLLPTGTNSIKTSDCVAAVGLEQVVLIICMENKNSMRKRKFEYYMNALHYCLYKGEVWSNFKVERQVYGLIGFLSTILGLRKYWVKRVEKLHNDK